MASLSVNSFGFKCRAVKVFLALALLVRLIVPQGFEIGYANNPQPLATFTKSDGRGGFEEFLKLYSIIVFDHDGGVLQKKDGKKETNKLDPANNLIKLAIISRDYVDFTIFVPAVFDATIYNLYYCLNLQQNIASPPPPQTGPPHNP
jgi:hypothetical protein